MKSILRSNLALGVIALVIHIGLSSPVQADVVTDWNQIANTTLAAGGVRFPPQTRTLAIMHGGIKTQSASRVSIWGIPTNSC